MMLYAHLALVFAVADLQSAEMLLGCSQLGSEISYARLVLTVLIQLFKAELLLFLDFRKHVVLLLQIFEDLTLVLLFVF